MRLSSTMGVARRLTVARILVVDDEESLRRLLRRTLEGSGHQVTEAGDGQTALEVLKDSPADLVITDLYMPNTDGLELILKLRAFSPGLKVIALSGGSQFKRMDTLSIAEQMGAYAAIRKPLDLESLLETVRRALDS